MGRRCVNFVLLLFLLMFVFICTVSAAPTVTDDKIAEVYGDLESLFPLLTYTNEFSVQTPIKLQAFSGVKAAYDMQTRKGAMWVNLYANGDTSNLYYLPAGTTPGDTGSFYFALDVTIDDLYPEDTGGCGIQYTSVPASRNATPVSVSFYMGQDAGASRTTAEGKTDIDLVAGSEENVAGGKYRLEVVRILGYAFFFVDGTYVGQVCDEISDPVVVTFGPSLFEAGEYISCAFDNAIYRQVTK